MQRDTDTCFARFFLLRGHRRTIHALQGLGEHQARLWKIGCVMLDMPRVLAQRVLSAPLLMAKKRLV